ncbi:protein mono-ADP-ribosyltransferase TIPARP-like [Pseudochaenichthys georgianus]|uniref:protein mono-ADP-ribosyltransferase TIPARP-like n=1 Tax=Pseudochaenichthys georgianus TaxID=52239 RepID=UPI00146D809B|nr:protein mono-ADP-ribosyltransferase TIPARP-like [Pseudochaenichthys georgianus]
MMPSSRKGKKRKSADSVAVLKTRSKPSKVTFLSPSLVLLEIPADTNTSLPVWEAMRSQLVDIAWTVNPYSISVNLTPLTAKQGKITTSSQTESTSTLVPPSTTGQAQMMIQALSPQQVLLSLSQNSTQFLPSPPGQPQNSPSTSTQANSIIVCLPLFITSPQPSLHQTSTLNQTQVLPSIPTLILPAKQQALSVEPPPSLFHTKISSDIQICDNFLLNVCHAGSMCNRHHTPYPFHWQLWCPVSHNWIDIPHRSQVSLERLYCDVNQRVICIKDGNVKSQLDFTSMDLDDSCKYDQVRRLTNSDCPIMYPLLASKWKIYWLDHFIWREYSQTLSTLLLKKMSEKEPECSYFIGSQEYMLDFTTMVQINVTTRFYREVRCRPVYRSPDSMKPYLKTGIQSDPAEPVSDPPGADLSVDPLKEFSSWYPPVWCLASEQDFSLVELPAGTAAYRSVQHFFHESLPETEVDIISIQQVENLLHWDKYQRHKAHMQKHQEVSTEPLERHLFHGTNKEASGEICLTNFDPRIAGLNGTSCGFGSYFSISASYSNTYSAIARPNGVRHMFLVKVLVGNVTQGMPNYRRPPPITSKKRPIDRYDTCVDDEETPTMFVVFDSCQCYPYYLIKYKDLPKEIEI